MDKPDHWKEFGELRYVTWFTNKGAGPAVIDLLVAANVNPNLNYPEARITIHGHNTKSGPGALGITVGQAIDLVKYLKNAIKEVAIACPTLALGTGERMEDLDG